MPRGGKREGAGRKPDSITKKKIDVYAALEKADVNVVSELISIAEKAKTGLPTITKYGIEDVPDFSLAASIYSGLLSYAAPKLKAIEVTGEDGGAIQTQSIINIMGKKEL